MVKPKLQDSYPDVSETDIADFESTIGAALPEEYRNFLLQNNGGEFSKEATTQFGPRDPRYASISFLHGLLTGDNSGLVDVHQLIKHYLPEGMLSIGDDLGGNHICIVVAGPEVGTIWSWDHEADFDDRWPPKNAIRIANSFDEFYEGLRYDEENAVDWVESEPAFMAAERGDTEKMRSLLDQGCDLESRNDRTQTLLICAASSRQSQIVQLLLARGADVHARDHNGCTALFKASASQSLDSAKHLLIAGADLDAANKDGDTPLLIGMAFGYRVPLYLIEQGANVNHCNFNGESPLALCGLFEDNLREPLLRAGAIE